MFLIQEINLEWGKNERGAKGEEARRRFPLAYPMQEKQFLNNIIVQRLSFFQKEAIFMDPVQWEQKLLQSYFLQLGFTQEQTQNEIQRRVQMIKNTDIQPYSSVSALNLTNLSVCFKKDSYDITFFYDEQRSGLPTRRGHNKDFHNQDSPFYRKDVLNHMVFSLSQNQYGRIIWNERRTDYDTGQWYYQLHIYNLFYLSSQPHLSAKQSHKKHRPQDLKDKNFAEEIKDIFVRNEPDYEYSQLAFLY